MNIFNEYSSIIVKSLLQLKEGDALSINTEESDFEFAKIIADMAVRITKVVVKIVITNEGRPSEVIDFEPYGVASQSVAFCMLHLKHTEDTNSCNDTLDVLVDKDDLRSIQKLGHLSDPIILDRRIVITWCVVPAYYANSEELKVLVGKLSNEFDSQILSVKYRKKFLNQTDICKFHVFGDECDFILSFPNGTEFIGGPCKLDSGREFVSGIDFDQLMCNIDKDSLDGWFISNICIFGKSYKVKLSFNKGVMHIESDCKQLKNLISFDDKLTKPGYISLSDKQFSIVFGSSLVDSLTFRPNNIEELPEWFNDSLYKYECRLEDKLNIEYSGSDGICHELVRKGFFLE